MLTGAASSFPWRIVPFLLANLRSLLSEVMLKSVWGQWPQRRDTNSSTRVTNVKISFEEMFA